MKALGVSLVQTRGMKNDDHNSTGWLRFGNGESALRIRTFPGQSVKPVAGGIFSGAFAQNVRVPGTGGDPAGGGDESSGAGGCGGE